jgi:hypothetical protein
MASKTKTKITKTKPRKRRHPPGLLRWYDDVDKAIAELTAKKEIRTATLTQYAGKSVYVAWDKGGQELTRLIAQHSGLRVEDMPVFLSDVTYAAKRAGWNVREPTYRIGSKDYILSR